jgi:hypothetical protein
VPLEVTVLLNFFDEMLPLSTDIYAACLNSDFDGYYAMLTRSLVMFVQLGKAHYSKICLAFMCLMGHWELRFPDIFNAVKDNLRETSEEVIELFHSTIAHHTSRMITAERLAEVISFHAAMRGTASSLATATGVHAHKGGVCRDHYPLAPAKMSEGIKGLFNACMSCSVPCSPDANGKEWHSATLGKFPDAAVPIALQQNPDALECPRAHLRKYKVEMGVRFKLGDVFHCGHPKAGSDSCATCLSMVMYVAGEVLKQLEKDICKRIERRRGK